MASPIETAGRHVVQFYERDADLLARAGGYLTGAVRAGEVAIVIATAAHREAFEAHLGAAGIDVAAARAAGTLVSVDAAETLARFMRDGRADRAGFLAAVGGIVRAAADAGRPVRAFGEMVALLWEAGDVTAAIDVETLWNELATEVPFSLYCAYRSESVAGHEHADALERVCRLHAAVVPAPPVDASWEFAAERSALSEARSRLAEALQRMGHDGELVDDARLVVTELAANAVVHARSPFSVTLRGGHSCVRILVRDRSPVAPAMRAESSTASSGRGLRLVAALARSWGVDHAPDGKVVWAELGR